MTTTLDDARKRVRFYRDNPEGITCPCCGQYAKTYQRTLTSNIGRFVIYLVAQYQKTPDWIDIKKFELRGGDYAKAVYWDLAERAPNIDKRKRTSGLWRPTLKGVDFARGRASVKKYAHVYNGTVESLSGPHMTIRDALGKKFDYSELMKATGLTV